MANDVLQAISLNSLRVSDWVMIGTSLFLGVVALIVPWFSELIKRHLFAPELDIEFSQNPPDCRLIRNKYFSFDGKISSDEPLYSFRFRVLNIGKTQARKCEVVLEQLSQADAAGHFKPIDHFSHTNIIWGSMMSDFVDINPKRKYFCDLIAIPSLNDQKRMLAQGQLVNLTESSPFDLGIILNHKGVFYSQPNRLPPGKYTLEVSVYSENCKTLTRSFVISWSGNWKDTEVNMFKEIVIEFIRPISLPHY